MRPVAEGDSSPQAETPQGETKMATTEFLSSVIEAVQVMESAMKDTQLVLDEATQRGEWLNPLWKALAQDARRLATQCQRLADTVQQIKSTF
jgi:hypothetical protein